MNTFPLLLLLLVGCAAGNAAQPATTPPSSGGAVANTSYTLDSGERVLRHEIVVDAPRAEVWKLWSTSEGLRSFVAPLVEIDLRPGGSWEASDQRDHQIGDPRNIQNEVLSFLPPEMLSIRIRRTPPGFPHPDVGKSVWTVIQLEEVSAQRTRVIISMLPWKSGADWDAVHAIFERGNAVTLERLRQRIATGPLNPKQ